VKATFRDGTDFDDVRARIGDRLILSRHDTCGALDLAPALRFAAMEQERGIRATYFVHDELRDFGSRQFQRDVERLRDLGHGIGLHYTAIPRFLRDGTPPQVTLERGLSVLRASGEVTLIAGHGDPSAYTVEHRPYECFSSFDPSRNEGTAQRWPMPLADVSELGVAEVYLHGAHTAYLSDSRGIWNGWCGDPRPRPFERLDGANRGLGVVDDAGTDATFQWLAHPCYWQIA
jgi:hypothetical protein